MLMQNTSLASCNLSRNVINKIPAKLAIKWTLLTGNLSILEMSDFLVEPSIDSAVWPSHLNSCAIMQNSYF